MDGKTFHKKISHKRNLPLHQLLSCMCPGASAQKGRSVTEQTGAPGISEGFPGYFSAVGHQHVNVKETSERMGFLQFCEMCFTYTGKTGLLFNRKECLISCNFPNLPKSGDIRFQPEKAFPDGFQTCFKGQNGIGEDLDWPYDIQCKADQGSVITLYIFQHFSLNGCPPFSGIQHLIQGNGSAGA